MVYDASVRIMWWKGRVADMTQCSRTGSFTLGKARYAYVRMWCWDVFGG